MKKEVKRSTTNTRKASELIDKPVLMLRHHRLEGAIELEHTRLNVHVIDTVSKTPIGIPWLTTVINADTNMFSGVHLNFDPKHEIHLKDLLHGRIPNPVNS